MSPPQPSTPDLGLPAACRRPLAVLILLLLALALWLLKTPLENAWSAKHLATDRAQQASAALFAEKIPDLAGIEQPLSQWQGKLLVVNVWAAWCPPCRKEIPGFSRLQKQYADKNLQFVGIALDQPERVKDFLAQLPTPINYPQLIGGQHLTTIFDDFGNTSRGLPFTVIIGRDGQAVRARMGLWQEAALEAVLQELLETGE